MKLFELNAELSPYATPLFKTSDDAKAWGDGWFEGTPRGKDYPIPSAEIDPDDLDLSFADFTHVGLRPIPTFSKQAIDAIGELLSAHGEFAFFELNEQIKYFAFNPTTIVDCLDEAKSDVARFSDGRVMAVDRYHLLDSVIELPPIFKIPQTRRNTTYVNEAFVRVVEKHRLTGFDFKLLFLRRAKLRAMSRRE